MSKYGFDKFYTKKEIAKECISHLNLKEYKTIIEPSAGNGSFSNLLPKHKIALDLFPECDSIIKQDFLKFNLSENCEKPILTIGNPPFGRNGSLALTFIKKASSFSDTIAFILPKSFKKNSFYDKIPLLFWKTLEIDLPENSFLFDNQNVDIPCVFQIYQKSNKLREKDKRPTKSNFFNFVKKEHANLSIRRVGFYAGKCYTDINKSDQSHYFINVKNPKSFFALVNQIEWEHNNTVGARSVSKKELVEKIEEKISALKYKEGEDEN